MKKLAGIFLIYIGLILGILSCDGATTTNSLYEDLKICQSEKAKLEDSIKTIEAWRTQCEREKTFIIDSLGSVLRKLEDEIQNQKPDTVTITIIDTLELPAPPPDTITIRDTVRIFEKALKNIEIKPDTARADTSDGIGAPMNAIDGILFKSREDKGTRWLTRGYPHSIAFSFDSLVFIDSVFINTFGWNEGYTHEFKVYSWGDSIAQFWTKEELLSGHELKIKTTQLVFEVLGGRNAYTDVGEFVFKGRKDGN